MRPKKRSKSAKDREQLKKRRINPLDTSDGSQYAPSDGESTDSSDAATKDEVHSQFRSSDKARDTLYELWESELDDVSESDGEIMLGLDDSFDENDWDPDLYPIFTKSVKSFKSAEQALRAPVYTRTSRTTSWRRQAAEQKRAKEAESCSDIRSFFRVKQKDAPFEQQTVPPRDVPLDTQQATEPAPTISYSLAISDDVESPSNLQEEVATSSGLFSRVHNSLELALGPQTQANYRHRSPETLSPSISSRPLSPLSQSPSPEPASSRFDESLPFEDKLNILALDSEQDPSASPTLPTGEDPDIENAPNAETPPLVHNPPVNQIQLDGPDSSVENRLKELRTTLTNLNKQLNAAMRSGKKKVDPRDPADIQALLDYCVLAEQLAREGSRNPEMSASLQIARTKVSTVTKDGDVISKGAWYARTLRSKAKHVRDFGQLPVRQQGKGGSHASLLDNPSVLKAVNAFLDQADVGKVTPRLLMVEVNTKILPPLMLSKSNISENTAKKWLLRLGFRRTTYKKGIYMDGHERPDVVAYRMEFLSKVAALETLMQQYSDKDCEPIPCKIPPGKRQIVAAFHDECCFHANEQTTNCWIRDGQCILRQKSRGRLIHVSDIIVEETGRLVLSDEEVEAQKTLPENERLKTWDARKIIYPGKNQAAYWDMPQLIAQIKDAIKIFEVKFPGAQMLLFVDQSSAHNAYAADSLNARKMNVGPGGKQPVMHDTKIPLDNPNPLLRGQPQSMVFPATHPDPNYANQPKGMEQVLKERGLWELLVTAAGGKRVVGRCKTCKATTAQREKILNEAQTILDENPELFGSIDNVLEVTQDESLELDNDSNNDRFCCMEKCLSEEADFRAEKPLLQLVVEEAGHLCILLPKFHCELNPIEMYWGYAKQRFQGQCNGSFTLAKELVPKCLDACPVQTIRRFFQKAWRLGDIYEKAQRGDKQLAFMDPADSFTLTLRPYQQQALNWMYNLERGEMSARESESLHPLWEEYIFPFEEDDGVIDLCADERSFYFNPYSGELSLNFVKTENHKKGGILADDMGMGKSIMMSSLIHTSRGTSPTFSATPSILPAHSIIAAFGKRKRGDANTHQPVEPHATLLVAPISLLSQWQSELERSSKPDTLRTLIWHGLNRANLAEVLGPQTTGERPVDVVITSYGTLSSEYANMEKGKASQVYDTQWMRVVLDEAHYCKSRHTKNAKACYRLNSVYRWALTGTPIVNRLEDLYSLLCFLQYEPWSSFAYFKSFVTTPFLNRDPRAIEIIQVILENVLLRREKSMKDVDGNQIVELPPKVMSIEELTFSPEERRIYEEIYIDAKTDFGIMDGAGTITKGFAHMFAQIMRLRQAVLHPDLIKAPKEDPDEVDVIRSDDGDDSYSNPEPSTDIQEPGHGECSICFESIKSPVVVKECGHTGCRKCFTDFLAMCQEKESEMVCPVCRTSISGELSCVAEDSGTLKEEAAEVETPKELVLKSQGVTASGGEFRSSTKVDALLRNLNELREQDPSFRAIVFSQFTSFLDIIQKALVHHGFENMRLDGSMSQQQRSQSLRSFTSPGVAPKIFCISLRAGGVGLNLTQAQYVFMMDFWWNRAAENQAIDRIHRIGQTRTVYVKHFVIKNTIEKRVLQIQKRKTAIVKGAFGQAGDKGTKESVQNMKLMFGD